MMKIPIACATFLAATISWGQVITSDLVLYLDANVDTDGSDGWDFTQPAVPGGGGTLPLISPANVPTNMVETEGGRYFRTLGPSEAFGGNVSTTAVYSSTFEIWLRVNGTQFMGSNFDNAVCAWRKNENFSENNCSINMAPGDQRDIDFDFRDHSEVRSTLNDRAELGFGDWHQVVFTYKDAFNAISDDGVLSTYLNGDPTPVNVVSNLSQYHQGFGVAPDHSELSYASAFMVAAGEANRNLNGDIAIIRLYDTDLTPAQITQNFDAQKDLYPFAGPPVPLAPTNQTDLVEIQLETVNGVIYGLERSADVTAPSNTWESTDSFIRGNGATMRMYDKTDASNPGFNRVSVSAP
jgi:hypothetical protein